MNPKYRVLPLLLLVILVMSVPVLAQEMPANETMSADGMITYGTDDCSYGGEMKSLQAVDANTVVMTLCFPDPALPSKVAFATTGIFSQAQLEATGGSTEEIDKGPIGTGPWKFDHWDLGNELVFTRNDNYWGDPAKEGQLIFRWGTEAAARLNELQAGTVDGIDNVGPTDFDAVKNNPDLQLLPVEGLNTSFIGINNTYKPLDDVRVRQAIAYGIDKQRIVDNFYPPGSTVADQFIPTQIFGYTPEVTPFPYDPDKAKQLLAEAAADDGFTLPLSTLSDGTPLKLSYRDVVRPYQPQSNVIAADIQTQLAAIGINVQLDVQESGTFLDKTAAGENPLSMVGWIVDYTDATDWLDTHFGAGADNTFGNKFPELVDAIAQGGKLASPDARYPFYVTANTLVRDLVPMVPIAHGGNAVAFKASIVNANVSSLNNENFSIMEDPDDDNIVWMQNGEPISLYCADETDGESIRACMQVNESLLAYETGGTTPIPALAESYDTSEDLLTWTFHLRPGVTFTDGSPLTANDVVMSYAVQWDAANPLHVGRTGSGLFSYWTYLFTQFLNAPQS